MKLPGLTRLILSLSLILGAAYISVAQNSSTPQPAVDNSKTETRSPSTTDDASSGAGTTKSPSITKSSGTTKSPSTTDAPQDEAGGYLSTFELKITTMIVVIALIALGMEFLLLRRIPNLKAEDALRVFAVTLILVGTLFFIAAGYDSNQVAPAMGLFGTVAGYLLGRSIDRKEPKDNA